MKIALTILLSIFSGIVLASAGITEKVLTAENVRDLGFSVSIEVSPEATAVKLVGPKIINKECRPTRSGVALLDNEGGEIMVSQTRLEHRHMVPVSDSYYYSPKTTVMSVWLDYICTPENVRNSRRYIVPSVREYLITSQSMSPPAGQP
jgi:hypothetical protein